MQQCISYRSNAHETLPPFRSRVHASHVIDAESQIMTRQTAASLTLLAGTVAKRATFDPSANRADYRSTDESRNAQRRIISKPNRQPNELAAHQKSYTCLAFGANSSKSGPIYCDVLVEGTPLTMEVDTGAEVSVISETTRKSLFLESKLAKTNVVLKTYTHETIPVLGELTVEVMAHKLNN